MGNQRQVKKHSRKPRRGKNGQFTKGPQKGDTMSEMVNYETAPGTEAPRETASAAAPVKATMQLVDSFTTPVVQGPWFDEAPAPKPWLRRAWEWLMGGAG